MKITVAGLGAIGALMAARLSQAGHEVAALARGGALQAVRRDGLRMEHGGRTTLQRIAVADDAAALPPAELVIVALKGPAFAASAARLAPLWSHGATVLPAMNGVPWWFLGDAATLRSVDPDGAIGRALPLAQVLGCVVHLSSSCPQPGHVRHGFGERLIVGEPGGGRSERVDAVAQALQQAGFQVERSDDVRKDIWFKLWGNMTMNPVSALTGASADRILDDELVRAFMARAMGEAAAVGERIGCPIGQSAEARMAVTRELGAFRTSMLQDVDAGRPIELDALVGAVREIGQRVGVPTPDIDALFGLARLMGRVRGLYA